MPSLNKAEPICIPVILNNDGPERILQKFVMHSAEIVIGECLNPTRPIDGNIQIDNTRSFKPFSLKTFNHGPSSFNLKFVCTDTEFPLASTGFSANGHSWHVGMFQIAFAKWILHACFCKLDPSFSSRNTISHNGDRQIAVFNTGIVIPHIEDNKKSMLVHLACAAATGLDNLAAKAMLILYRENLQLFQSIESRAKHLWL